LLHSNIDRYWALWQDCYDYDKVPPSQITNNIFPLTWLQLGAKTNYTIDQKMPYNYPTLPVMGQRLSVSGSTPCPRDMHFIGNATQSGYNGMNYRYSTDRIVAAMNSDPTFAGICNFDTIVNVPIPGRKRSVEDVPQYIFNNTVAQQQLNQIKTQYGYHTTHQKVHYLALWECSRQNMVAKRNYTVPVEWCTMNGHDPSEWMTTCEREGWLNGWGTLAWLDDQAYSKQALATASWAVPVAIVIVVVIVLGAIGLYSLYFYQKKRLQRVEGGDDLQEPLVEL